ncbi:hypothetical protein JXA85_01245 [Candidatus Woesearchaeota archaeon]|nr:hypothetical protein [Candidatus Woesearchaeota archaeon]
MKITFDTKTDTKDDFDKVIRMLQIMRNSPHSEVLGNDSSVEVIDTPKQDVASSTPGLFDMFGSSEPQQSSQPYPETSTILPVQEKKEAAPKLTVYEY